MTDKKPITKSASIPESRESLGTKCECEDCKWEGNLDELEQSFGEYDKDESLNLVPEIYFNCPDCGSDNIKYLKP